MSGAVLTVGSVLRGDDAAGPMLAKLLEDSPARGWEVLDGGQMPEDYLPVVRRLRPEMLLVVDAADMGLEPGEVRMLGESDVATGYLTTTHSLPLSYLLSELRECCGEVVFLGIQPAHTGFFAPLTPAVLRSVEDIHVRLVAGTSPPGAWYPRL